MNDMVVLVIVLLLIGSFITLGIFLFLKKLDKVAPKDRSYLSNQTFLDRLDKFFARRPRVEVPKGFQLRGWLNREVLR